MVNVPYAGQDLADSFNRKLAGNSLQIGMAYLAVGMVFCCGLTLGGFFCHNAFKGVPLHSLNCVLPKLLKLCLLVLQTCKTAGPRGMPVHGSGQMQAGSSAAATCTHQQAAAEAASGHLPQVQMRAAVIKMVQVFKPTMSMGMQCWVV